MRKTIIFLLTALILTATPLTALAAAPVDISQSNVNGRELLEKTYELFPGEDPNSVIEEPFERDGFIYNLETIRFEEVKKIQTKDTLQTVTVVTQSDDSAEILKKFTGSISYTDEGGYTGTLYIETGSLLTEVEDYETKWYTVTDTKEYFSMLMNDPSGIPQSTVKNGVTLKLKDINWVVTGTSLAGDSLVPTEYKAVVSYSGSYSKQIPTGYVTTANYRGQLTLEFVEKLLVKVTYTGTLIPTPEPTPEPTTEPEGEHESGGLNPLWIVLILGVLVLGGTGAAILFLRRPQVEISCLDGEDYKPVAKEPFNPRQPVIDLTGLRDKLLSLDLAFTLDKKMAAGMKGGKIAVLLDGNVLQHAVDLSAANEDKYTFYIDFGGSHDE
jgi:hypothetical protein